MSDPTAHPSLLARLAEFREEAAGLLGDIDTRVRPKPDRVEPADERQMSGPVWEPAGRWTLRVVDPDDSTASVFVNHPHIWDDDLFALNPIEARRIGMAFLAAADWADKVRSRAITEEQPDA